MSDETIIWHNPRCSKSRAALKLLEAHGITPKVRRYLDEPPDEEEIRKVLARLGKRLIEIMRTKEQLFRELGLAQDSDDETLIRAMVAHPKLIERPIVIRGDRAVLGRPPEKVLEIL